MKITDDMLTDEVLLDIATEVGIPTDCDVSDGLLVRFARAAIERQAAIGSTPDRETIIEECAKVCEAWSASIDTGPRRNRVVAAAMQGALTCAFEIRAIKNYVAPFQPFSLTEDDLQEGVAFQYAHGLVAKRLRGDKGGA